MFISLEGIDGSGKSTQAKLLAEALGPETLLIREPGGTDAAERIRELLADPALELDPYAELLLFLAARADLTARVIRPALEAGRDVVSDRFADSTVAYQGAARGLGVGETISLTDAATEGLWPDLTILLRVDPEVGHERADGEDRFESEGLDLQRAVAEAYEEIAQIASDRVVVVDGNGAIEEVHEQVMEAVGVSPLGTMTAGQRVLSWGGRGCERALTGTRRAMLNVPASNTEHQPRARVVLSAALQAGPSHAYLLRGPRGSGKRAVARAFAAEILAPAAEDPDDARRRALLDPSPHPDFVWIAPRGAQHLVEEVREQVIRAAVYRPFEGGKRVFVIEAAEAMRDESQNALLKTLEEPPDFVHLILLTSEPESTPRDRRVPLPADRFRPTFHRGHRGCPARRGRLRRDRGRRSPLGGKPGTRPLPAQRKRSEATRDNTWRGGSSRGRLGESAVFRRVDPDCSLDRGIASADSETGRSGGRRRRGRDPRSAGGGESRGGKRSTRDVNDEAKRVARRRRTEFLDLGLELSRPGSATSPRSPPAPPRSSTTRTVSLSSSPKPRAWILHTPAKPPSWSRTPAAVSTSTSPRNWRSRLFTFA